MRHSRYSSHNPLHNFSKAKPATRVNVHTETESQREARWAAARANMPLPETRDEQVARWEANGLLDPTCATCQREVYARPDKMPSDVWMPRHKASASCQSGKHAHCTCDTCF